MPRFLILFVLLLLHSVDSCAEEIVKRGIFVVETDKETASESLERISGRYDLGFSASSQTYESSSHYMPGPLARQKAFEKTTES